MRSDSDIGEADPTSDEDLDDLKEEDQEEERREDGGKMGGMFQMMNHIQSLISRAVENAKQEDNPNGEFSYECR